MYQQPKLPDHLKTKPVQSQNEAIAQPKNVEPTQEKKSAPQEKILSSRESGQKTQSNSLLPLALAFLLLKE